MISLSRLTVLLFFAAFLCHFTACIKQVPLPDTDQIEEESFLYVRLKNGDLVKVKNPKIEDDFLFGKTPVYDTRPGPYKEVKIPLDEIENMQVERFSLTKTIITFGIIGSTLGTFIYFVSQFEDGFN